MTSEINWNHRFCKPFVMEGCKATGPGRFGHGRQKCERCDFNMGHDAGHLDAKEVSIEY